MNIFRRPATHYGKSPEPETPYQKAAQAWDERIGSARVQAKNWPPLAFGSLILPAVVPAVAWVLTHRAFLERMRATRGAA